MPKSFSRTNPTAQFLAIFKTVPRSSVLGFRRLKNTDIEDAWSYHNGTKHPNGRLLNRTHTFHPASRPVPYKSYKDGTQIKLVVDSSPGKVSALDAISASPQEPQTELIPDSTLLSKILFFAGGITKTIRFAPPLGDFEFRAASCTGALYHIEKYVVCSDIPGLAAGVYHFNPKNNSLVVLRSGDYRKILTEASADDLFVARSPVTLILTDVFSRNAIKYQAREYRHAFWDCGTIISNALAMASCHKIPYKLILGFLDSKVNRFLDLDEKTEAVIAILPLGLSHIQVPDAPSLGKIPHSEPAEGAIDISPITDMHESSCLSTPQEVIDWRENMGVAPSSTRRQVKIPKTPDTALSLEETIMRRGSTRRFSHDSIPLDKISTILKMSTFGIASDFAHESTVPDIYLIINAVDGLEQGAYFYNGQEGTFELLQQGDFRDMSGHLGLDQRLPYDASATIFLMTNMGRALGRFGNRGYRAAQMEASIIAGRIYLASYALRLGATGLTFYDDEVAEFFSPHSNNKSMMFMLAVGKKEKNISR